MDDTQKVYEDTDIVKGYIQAHSLTSSMKPVVEAFARTLPGKTVIDIGCGPGHDSYIFHEFGFDVTGVDYSSAMIDAAKNLHPTDHPPAFVVGDMRKLTDMFQPGSFDGAWACASLLHIPYQDIPDVLDGIHTIVKAGGKVFIALKEGAMGEKVVREDKYGKPMDRTCMFWEREPFEAMLTEHGFKVDKVDTSQSKSAKWLEFFLTVQE